MCRHMTIRSDVSKLSRYYGDSKLTKEALELKATTNLVNGADHKRHPVITCKYPNEIKELSWGLIPSFCNNQEEADKFAMMCLHARAEELESKVSYRGLIWKQRCLIPSTGFFEFNHFDKKKQSALLYIYEG